MPSVMSLYHHVFAYSSVYYLLFVIPWIRILFVFSVSLVYNLIILQTRSVYFHDIQMCA